MISTQKKTRLQPSFLDLKISRLQFSLDKTWVYPLIHDFYDELKSKRLSFLPPVFLTTEWFTPVGIPAIGIPFYLCDESLIYLEKKYIGEAEGSTKKSFMKLIRHEAGHAYSYAYNLYRKRKWQSHFGLASSRYSSSYKVRPHSKAYVRHLDNHYAQSHPDEDFAETFAVWLTPDSDWKSLYNGWPVMQKLEYVDELMNSISGMTPFRQTHFDETEISGLDVTFREYFKEKKRLYGHEHRDYFDRDLTRIFSRNGNRKQNLSASKFIRSRKGDVITSANRWTKQSKTTIKGLLNDIISRCDELDLVIAGSESETSSEFSEFITSRVMHYAATGKFGDQ